MEGVVGGGGCTFVAGLFKAIKYSNTNVTRVIKIGSVWRALSFG